MSMRVTPSSTARRRTAIASSRSWGSPHVPRAGQSHGVEPEPVHREVAADGEGPRRAGEIRCGVYVGHERSPPGGAGPRVHGGGDRATTCETRLAAVLRAESQQVGAVARNLRARRRGDAVSGSPRRWKRPRTMLSPGRALSIGGGVARDRHGRSRTQGRPSSLSRASGSHPGRYGSYGLIRGRTTPTVVVDPRTVGVRPRNAGPAAPSPVASFHHHPRDPERARKRSVTPWTG